MLQHLHARLRKPLLGLLLIAIFFFLSVGFKPTNGSLEHRLLLMAMNQLQGLHYQVFGDSDEHSRRIHRLFLSQLDWRKQLFTQKEIEVLDLYKEAIDDHLKDGQFEVMTSFLLEALKQHKIAVDRAEGIVNELLGSHAFNYEREEVINFDQTNKPYVADEVELKERWRRYLKTLMMDYFLTEEEIDREAKKENSAHEMRSQEAIAKEVREQVRESMSLYFKRVREVKERDRFNQFVDAVAMSYDPHTTYHPPVERDQFNESMRGNFQGIGARLMKDGDYVKITEVIVGGPAYRQKQLKAGDVILKVGQGDDEPVSAIGMGVGDAADIIRGPKGTVVKLTVRRNGNEIVVVPIIRGVVKLEETSAKSSVAKLSGSPSETYGYIHLPMFYRDFSDRISGRSCARDVEKELRGLIDQNVGGVVFDLRNNGGGSLHDAIDIVGLFIDASSVPVVSINGVVRGRRNVRHDYEFDKKLATPLPYKGPLVVMINEGSASASEIVSAALQDYGRALVVGSKTFGKGTVQGMFPIMRNNPEMGVMRITIQKFYRISGETTQYKGVIPDIVFPTLISLISAPAERERLYSIPWDTIEPVPYAQTRNVTPEVEAVLLQSHTERTKTNAYFGYLRSNHDAFEAWFDDLSQVPLKRSKYNERRHKLSQWRDELKEITDKSERVLDMLMPEFTEAQMKDDSFEDRKLIVKNWHEQLEKDVYLQEAFEILNDLAKSKGAQGRSGTSKGSQGQGGSGPN